MLKRNEEAQQRWQGAHQSIDRWLHERQQLLIDFCQLAGFAPYEREKTALPENSEITQFCQHMVDYVSAGHFEIYDQIIRNSKQAPASTRELADDLFPLIIDTTEIALDFNDRYGSLSESTSLPNFDNDLSELGEALELRMEFEDRLLATLEQHQLL